MDADSGVDTLTMQRPNRKFVRRNLPEDQVAATMIAAHRDAIAHLFLYRLVFLFLIYSTSIHRAALFWPCTFFLKKNKQIGVHTISVVVSRSLSLALPLLLSLIMQADCEEI